MVNVHMYSDVESKIVTIEISAAALEYERKYLDDSMLDTEVIDRTAALAILKDPQKRMGVAISITLEGSISNVQRAAWLWSHRQNRPWNPAFEVSDLAKKMTIYADAGVMFTWAIQRKCFILSDDYFLLSSI